MMPRLIGLTFLDKPLDNYATIQITGLPEKRAGEGNRVTQSARLR